MIAAILAMFVGGPMQDSCCIWERNTVVCEQTGQPVMVQHIWWEMRKTKEFTDYVVRDWRLDKDVPCKPNTTEHGVLGVFRDGKDGTQRAIHARLFMETVSTTDFERADAERFSTNKRQALKRAFISE